MKAIHALALLGILGAVAVPLASARGGYRVQAIAQFKLPADQAGKPSITCQYCHQNPQGGASWNAFGENVRTQFFGEANKNIADALFLALKARKDSDGDGYDDVLEVVAFTQPGNKDSKPSVSKDTLEAELKAWGGVNRYKAKK